MQQVEVLREVKQAEAEVKSLREEASRKAAQILRDAERRANETIEQAKADAENEAQSALEKVQKEVSAERTKVLQRGEREAEQIQNRKGGSQAKAAVDELLTRFNKRING